MGWDGSKSMGMGREKNEKFHVHFGSERARNWMSGAFGFWGRSVRCLMRRQAIARVNVWGVC